METGSNSVLCRDCDLKTGNTLCTRWVCLYVCIYIYIYLYEAEDRRNPTHLESGRCQLAEGENWNFKVIF